MFELGLARRYLVPKRRGLSVALIATMSVVVISLVVWLVLLFLSITEGIEKKWLNKLTALNAPIRIVPTRDYFQSYYYNIDTISSASDYRHKNFQEKLRSSVTDPYDPTFDEELPGFWQGDPSKDLVKLAFSAIEKEGLLAQEYEVTGAMLRLRLMRPTFDALGGDEQRFLTQVSYISSMSGNNPNLDELIEPPSLADLNQMIYHATLSDEGNLQDQSDVIFHKSKSATEREIRELFSHIEVKRLATLGPGFRLPLSFLPDQMRLKAYYNKGRLSTERLHKDDWEGMLIKRGMDIVFAHKGRETFIDKDSHLVIAQNLQFRGKLEQGLKWRVEGNYDGILLRGLIDINKLQIIDATFKTTFEKFPDSIPPWAFKVGDKWHLPSDQSVILPKSFRDSNVVLGDTGYLSFGTATSSKMQEMRLPIKVAGFYDPGIMAIGAKCIMAPPELVHTISASTNSLSVDPLLSNGIQVWLPSLSKTHETTAALEKRLEDLDISNYFRVIPYHEYDFAKDLLLQFQSDKYLFTLIGLIILIVACTNIITLLLLLVNDKRREIGMLQAMGAPKRSIALIFGACGMLIGVVACGIGTVGAYLTLSYIDPVIGMISKLQGHDLFSSVFYGQSLPSQMSYTALLFTLLTTPVIALIAGLVPALKACRLKPSEILRSE